MRSSLDLRDLVKLHSSPVDRRWYTCFVDEKGGSESVFFPRSSTYSVNKPEPHRG